MCPGDSEIIRLLAGEMGDPQAQRVRTHIDACAVCSKRLLEFESVSKLLGEADLLPPQRDLTEAILRAASRPTISTSPMRIAAAVLLAIGAGVTVGAALPIERPLATAQVADPDAALDALGIDVLAADYTGLTSIFTPSATNVPEEPS